MGLALLQVWEVVCDHYHYKLYLLCQLVLVYDFQVNKIVLVVRIIFIVLRYIKMHTPIMSPITDTLNLLECD